MRRTGTFLIIAALASWLCGGAVAIAASARATDTGAPRLALVTSALAKCPGGNSQGNDNSQGNGGNGNSGNGNGGNGNGQGNNGNGNGPLCPPICDEGPTTPPPAPATTSGSSVDMIITVQIVDARCQTGQPTPPATKPPKPTPPTQVEGEKYGPGGGKGGGKLPYTGAPLAGAVAVSFVLFASGLGLRTAARRPVGRHRAK